MRRILLTLPLLLLAGCHSGGQDDLHKFVQNAGVNMRGHVEPLPEVKPYQPFVYNDFDQPDPFKPRKLKFNAAQGGIQPDLNRPKELLESFALETLKMVGVIRRNGENYAIIKTPLKTIYIVKVGNYLGQNFGKVVAITDNEVKLREIVQDGAGDWSERDSSLILREK